MEGTPVVPSTRDTSPARLASGSPLSETVGLDIVDRRNNRTSFGHQLGRSQRLPGPSRFQDALWAELFGTFRLPHSGL